MPRATIIEPQNEGEAPLSYQLSPGQTIETLAVAADFDGTGAAGDFLPTLSMYAQDGRRLGTFSAQTTVVVGNSEQVTFFPFAPPASSGGTVSRIVSGDGSIQVFNPTGPTVDIRGYSPPIEHETFDTTLVTVASGGSAFLTWTHLADDSLLNLAAPQAPKVKIAAIYGFTGTVLTNTAIVAGERVDAVLSLTTGGAGLGYEASFVAPTGGGNALLPIAGTFRCSTADTIRLEVFNHTAGNQDFGIDFMWVQKVT